MSDNPTNKELEEAATRLLRRAGNMKKHGILSDPGTHGARHELRVSEDELDYLANRPRDRRSTRAESDD